MTKAFYIITLLFICLGFSSRAQSFVNGDLDGIVNFISVPTGWTQIPFTDPICQGISAPSATLDVADIIGPSATGGIAGIPQSGSTFCTGLHSSIQPTSLWHEGIMQDVSGFAIGATYEISLYQAVVKQSNCIDQSGSWRVYLDGLLIGTTAPTVSLLAPDDLNLQWENRIVSFVATANSHTLKFIPWDDDGTIESSLVDIAGGLRMGIDNISFILPNSDLPIVDLGPDTLLCLGNSIVLDATFPNSTYLWQDNSTNPTLIVNQAGIYWVDVTNPFGTTRDSIVVSYDSIPTVSLADFILGCPPETIVVDAISIPSATYLWQDNSTNSFYSTSEPGIYTVTVSNSCGSASDNSIVTANDCDFTLEMPNVFTPNDDETNDYFLPVDQNGIDEVTFLILNRWGQIVYEATELTPGWNGEFNGTPCTSGAYFWKIETRDFNGNRSSAHGIVHLIR